MTHDMRGDQTFIGRGPAGRPRRHHSGVAIIYVLAMMTLLIGICSLAVDFGRVELDKEQLQCVADAAARAGLFKLPTSVAAAQTAAVGVAAANTVDGSAVSISASTDVAFGTWNPVTQSFTTLTGTSQSSANAVQVTVSRTAAKGNAVPLLFAGILGQTGCNVNATAVACKATDIALVNTGFESPAASISDFNYNYALTGWTLTGTSAAAVYGSAWNSADPPGNQSVALQGAPGNTLGAASQAFTAVAGTYQVSFYAAQRTGYNNPTGGVQPVKISIDGTAIATVTPTSSTFAQYTTPSFAMATGSHTLSFSATTNSVDLTTFIDTVAINVVTAPVYLGH